MDFIREPSPEDLPEPEAALIAGIGDEFQSAFETYIECCYDNGLDKNEDQYKQLRQAFLAGVYTATVRFQLGAARVDKAIDALRQKDQ